MDRLIGTALLATVAFVATLTACSSEARPTVKAAKDWTKQYKQQHFRARAAGSDCGVLLISTRATLDDGAVESLHYGTAEYLAAGIGVQRFAEDRAFRAVVYRDSSGALWTYGSTTRDEARSLPVCN